mmetsp:Transcript_987/g.1423  ORF Transcript_987/g.1423 Transcript_987/m.1423 type:complete len:83 (-) Transcript_987:1099-1347(-)
MALIRVVYNRLGSYCNKVCRPWIQNKNSFVASRFKGDSVQKSFAVYSVLGFIYGYAVGEPYVPSIPVVAFLNIQAQQAIAIS